MKLDVLYTNVQLALWSALDWLQGVYQRIVEGFFWVGNAVLEFAHTLFYGNQPALLRAETPAPAASATPQPDDVSKHNSPSAGAQSRAPLESVNPSLSSAAPKPAASTEAPASPAAQTRAPKPAAKPAPPPPKDNESSDEMILARMIGSEDARPRVKAVTGWLILELAKARKQSLREFVLRPPGRPLNKRGASGAAARELLTGELPAQDDRILARALLSGRLMPSFAIQQHRPGAWQRRWADLSDEDMLKVQSHRGQGLYGRIQGTDVYLLSPSVPAVVPKPGQTASQALDMLPDVPAIDGLAQLAA